MNIIHFETEIWQGETALAGLASLREHRIFLVADPFLVESGEIDKITRHLEGIEYKIFSDIIPDPPVEKIISGVVQLNQFQGDTIVAVGGGSAIDAAKAMKFFANKILTEPVNCFIAIPTTSGTGSEVTNFAVITMSESETKYPLVTPEIQPDIAILDTELVMGVPKNVTADTGIDVLTHILEAYVSKNANEFSDAYCEKAIQMVFEFLPRAYQDGTDQEARAQMHLASCMAGMAFNLTSLGLNHGIAHAAGAKLHVPHGRMNSILLPEVIKFNAQLEQVEINFPTAKKYQQLANCLGAASSNPRIGTKTLIRKIEALRKSLQLPATLSEFGLDKKIIQDNCQAIAEGALVDGCTSTNPIQPTLVDITKILNDIS